MNRRAVSRRGFLGLAAATPVLAGMPWEKERFWEKVAFPEWSSEQVDQLLTKSPWAREHDLRFDLTAPRERRPVFDYSGVGLRGGSGWPQGGGVPGIPGTGGRGSQRGPSGYPGSGGGGGSSPSVMTETYLTIRWSSALPIRQAMALESHGRRIPDDAMAQLQREPSEYVVEVFGLPAIVVHKEAGEFADELADHSFLDVRNGPRIHVDSVQMPPHGTYLSMTFRFPRERVIALEQKEVVFYAAAGPFEIEQKFKLKNMVYRGALAL